MTNDSARHVRALLCLSGLSGFIIGVFGYPSWQHCLEGAQVLAGIVRYPEPTPFSYYLTQAWTLLHQIPALLLFLGVPEKVLAFLISGLLGTVSFQALSLATYALTKDFSVSLGMPAFILLTKVFDLGVAYPIWLMGGPQSYGIVGLSSSILVISLLSLGYVRSGVFLLGLLPSIHITWGIMATGIVFLGLLWDWKAVQSKKEMLRFYLAGLLLTAVNFVIHTFFFFEPNLWVYQRRFASYFYAFIRYWDAHRFPISMMDHGVLVSLSAAVLGFFLRKSLLGKTSCLAGLFGLIFIFMTWLPAEMLPPAYHAFLPQRLLNYPVLLFVPLAMGIFWNWAHFPYLKMLTRGVFYLALAYALVTRISWGPENWKTLTQDRTENPVLAEASKGSGILLTSPELSQMQLFTRRPILFPLDEMDFLVYFPQTAPRIAEVIKDIFGWDFFNNIDGEDEKIMVLWERRGLEDWRQIQKKYGVTEILTSPKWKLQLPVEKADEQYTLYRIAS